MAVFENDNRRARVAFLQGQCEAWYNEEQQDAATIAESLKAALATVGKLDLAKSLKELPYQHMVFEGGQHFTSYAELLSTLLGTFAADPHTLAKGSGYLCSASAAVFTGAKLAGYIALRRAAMISLVRDIGAGAIPTTLRWLPLEAVSGTGVSGLLRAEMGTLAEAVPFVRSASRLGRFAGRAFVVTAMAAPILEGISYLLEKGELKEAIRHLAEERVKYYYGKRMMDTLKTEVLSLKTTVGTLKKLGKLDSDTTKDLLQSFMKDLDDAHTKLRADAVNELKKMDTDTNQFVDDDPEKLDVSFMDPKKVAHLKKLTISHGWVVDSITNETTDVDDQVRFGGNSGTAAPPILFDDDEYISSVTWQPGTYQGKKVVSGLKITTSKGKTHGPFGNGNNITSDAAQTFTVPAELRVVRLVDLDASVHRTGGKLVWDNQQFVRNLKMEVRRVE